MTWTTGLPKCPVSPEDRDEVVSSMTPDKTSASDAREPGDWTRQLLPCPFCGAGAYLYENEVDFVKKWSVGCTECNADMDVCEDEEPYAVMAWNTRAACRSPAVSTEELGADYWKTAYENCGSQAAAQITRLRSELEQARGMVEKLRNALSDMRAIFRRDISGAAQVVGILGEVAALLDTPPVASTERPPLNQKTRCEECNLLAPCDDPECPNAVNLPGHDETMANLDALTISSPERQP